MKIGKQLYVIVLYVCVSTAVVHSQEISIPQPGGFRKISDYPVITAGSLQDYINGAARNYLSYGFTDLNVSEYRKGRNIIKLEIYRLGSNVGAFGIYSTERVPGVSYLNIGSQGYSTGGILNFFKGNFYVKLRTNSGSERIIQSLESFAVRVADILPGVEAMPDILKEFPANGKLLYEESYSSEGILGHDFLKNAFKALYEADGTRFSIFILTRDSEEETRKTVSDYLRETGDEMNDIYGGKYVLKDGYNGTIFLAWKGSRIVIISGLAIDQTDIADWYTSEILD